MADQSTAELSADKDSGQSVPLDTRAATSQDTTPAQTAPATPVDSTAATQTPAPMQNTIVAPSQANVDTAATSAAPAATETPSALPTDQAGVAAPAADPNALVMNFTADCWLEVTDATGKKLFSGMQRKDGNLNLTGQAPYKLKIGAPAAVQIQYQGKPVDLSRFIRTNQVARLTLNAEPTPAQ